MISYIKNHFTEIILKEFLMPSVEPGFGFEFLDIDQIATNGELAKISLINALQKHGTFGDSLNDRLFMKKILIFFSEFHSKNAKLDVEFFNKRLKTDNRFKDELIEHTIINLNAYLDFKKAKMYARLMKRLLLVRFDWAYFLTLSSCLATLNLNALTFFNKIAAANFKTEDVEENNRDYANEALLATGGIAYTINPWSSDFYVSQLGKDLYNFGIKE